MNHQVRSVYDAINGVTSFLTWDADGQLRDVMRPCLGDVRHHWWNEAGQMVAMVDNEQCGYYGYNADGERVYKLTGQSMLEQYNAGEQHFQMFFNDPCSRWHFDSKDDQLSIKLGFQWRKQNK